MGLSNRVACGDYYSCACRSRTNIQNSDKTSPRTLSSGMKYIHAEDRSGGKSAGVINRGFRMERLEKCRLTKLDKGSCRGSQTERCKLMTNKEITPCSSFFQLANRSRLLGHRYRIFRKSKCTSYHTEFLIAEWSKLGFVGVIKDWME